MFFAVLVGRGVTVDVVTGAATFVGVMTGVAATVFAVLWRSGSGSGGRGRGGSSSGDRQRGGMVDPVDPDTQSSGNVNSANSGSAVTLPALPMSLVLGTTCYFAARYMAAPFVALYVVDRGMYF